MLRETMLYSYNDIMVQPSIISNINSRSECNPYKDSYLPIFTAPMSTVVDLENILVFNRNHIIPILPRNIDIGIRLINSLVYWSAFSLQEFEKYFCIKLDNQYNVLIDIANGHMYKLYKLVEKAKSLNPQLKIMVGNIANPDTYIACNNAGVDFVRVGIGAGNGCITSSNTAIHYPMASLVYKCWKIKEQLQGTTKIIADGGIRNYSDVIKALALGADYVMIGSLFAQCKESAGEKTNGMVNFYGMASKEGQCDLNGNKTKTAEGIVKQLPVKYTLRQWSTNMADYLKSAMSYCNIRDIQDFNPYNVACSVISSNTKNSINS